MRDSVTLLMAVVVLAISSLVAAQVPPPPPPPPPPTQVPANPQAPARDAVRVVQKTGTGVIRGRVMAAGTTQALRRARLSLTAPGVLTMALTTSSDGEGRFEFKQLPAGRFNLFVQKTGYVNLQYGQRRAREPGKPVDLAEGQTIENLEIPLPRGAVIAGRVVDDTGDPIEPVRVTAMQFQYYQGRRRLVPVASSAQANDLGQYRIYGLPPGTYYAGTMAYAAAADEGVSYAQTFYPGTADMSQAEPIAVKVGQERLNVDFAFVASRTARVSGVVYDSRGRPVPNVQVSSQQSVSGPSQGSYYGGPSATTLADGRFTFSNLRPGEHDLSVSVTNPDTGEREEASAAVTVVGVDIDGIALATTVGSRVTGRFRFDASVEPSFPSSKLGIRQGTGATMLVTGSMLRFSSSIKPDWTFELKGVSPGKPTFQVTGLPTGWAVKAVLHRGRDVADSGLDVTANQDVSGVEVVLTDKASEVIGAVSDEHEQPVGDYTIVVFPEDPSKWLEGSRLLVVARPDQNGRFTVRGLPPGKYYAIALEYVAQGDSNDPEFLRGVQSRATRFTLEENEKKTLDLKLVRVEG